MTSKSELTAQLADVTAQLVITQEKLARAEAAKKTADERRHTAEKRYRDLYDKMQQVVKDAPKPVQDGTYVWDGFVTLAPLGSLGSIPSLIGK